MTKHSALGPRCYSGSRTPSEFGGAYQFCHKLDLLGMPMDNPIRTEILGYGLDSPKFPILEKVAFVHPAFCNAPSNDMFRWS